MSSVNWVTDSSCHTDVVHIGGKRSIEMWLAEHCMQFLRLGLLLHHIFLFFTACMSKYSAGCIYYYPSFHHSHNPAQAEKLQKDLKRYLTRKIGFEAVMRIRCTKGILRYCYMWESWCKHLNCYFECAYLSQKNKIFATSTAAVALTFSIWVTGSFFFLLCLVKIVPFQFQFSWNV